MNNRKLVFILLLIFLFSLTFRIPIQGKYPKGYDTYTSYKLSTDIKQKGYIGWVLNPLSLTGFIPISYPTGGILLLSILSTITETSIPIAIILWNFVLILILTFFIYLISFVIFKNKLVSFITTLIYLNCRFLISYSDWFYSVRNLFLVLFIFLIWLFICKDLKNKFVLVLIVLLLMLITHRLVVVAVLIIAPYILSRFLKKEFVNSKYFLYLVLALSLLFLSVSFYFIANLNVAPLIYSPIRTNIEYLDVIIDIIFRFCMQIGVITVLIPLGYAMLLFKKNKNEKDVFVIMTVTFFIPFLSETTYSFYLMLPFWIIAASYFFEYLLRLSYMSKSYLKIGVICLIIISLILPLFITVRESKSDITFVRDQTNSLKTYLLDKADNEVVVCNYHEIYCDQLTALSNNKIRTLSTLSDLMVADRYNISNWDIDIRLKQIFSFKDPILNKKYFDELYSGYIIHWNLDSHLLSKIIEFTKVGYILDSNNPDSLENRPILEKKFGDLNQIYDNGLQQIKPLK